MKFLITMILFMAAQLSPAAAQNANDIIGIWKSAQGTSTIQIYKKGELFFGKILSLKEPNDASGKPRVDINNPSEGLQSRPLVGLEMITDFAYKGDGLWAQGKIYDLKTGNTYNGQMKLAEQNKLNIRAFFGLNFLGKTETWTRD